MKSIALATVGAVLPLVAAAALAVVSPPLATWALVMAIAALAGACVALVGRHLSELLVSIRERSQAGLEAVVAVGEATKTNQIEASRELAERFERLLAQFEERDGRWQSTTLAEWRATRAEVAEAQSARTKATTELVEGMGRTLAADVGSAVGAVRELVEMGMARQRDDREAEREHVESLVVSIREQIQAGLKAVVAAGEATRASQIEVGRELAERFERFLAEFEERDGRWQSTTLAEWRATRAEVAEAQSAGTKATTELVEGMGRTLAADVGSAVGAVRELVETGMARQENQRRTYLENLGTVTKTVIEELLAEWHEKERELHKEVLAEWNRTTSAFERKLESVVAQERTFQEQASRSRAESIRAELASVKETFELVEDTRNKLNAELEKFVATLRELVKAETQRQQDERDHVEKMLERQRRAHDEAAERSGQLWEHLLDQLNR